MVSLQLQISQHCCFSLFSELEYFFSPHWLGMIHLLAFEFRHGHRSSFHQCHFGLLSQVPLGKVARAEQIAFPFIKGGWQKCKICCRSLCADTEIKVLMNFATDLAEFWILFKRRSTGSSIQKFEKKSKKQTKVCIRYSEDTTSGNKYQRRS